jgi:methionyl-tRNA synthetase
MSAEPKKFYLTTPIYYVNARPHIGHAYTTIVADVLARRHRLLGDETFFLTGTDEHGQKIERSAAAAGIPPQQFADQVAAQFRTLWDRMGITYDKFIRTTDPEHARGVQKLWSELKARGFIELRSYTGTYCVSDEAFVDVIAGEPCPDCSRITEIVTEENYFFKLSMFQERLIKLIESDTLKIENGSRRNEVLSFLRGNIASVFLPGELRKSHVDNPVSFEEMGSEAVKLGRAKEYAPGKFLVIGALKDLSISRSSFKWGIPVPDDDKHVIYVWLDALANYITALGYGSDDTTKFEKFWLTRSEVSPLHLVGKEIIRFHCVYWPAFLLAADIPIPKAITAHGWLLFDNSKMSKSKGNIVRTETILDAFGTLCPPKPETDGGKAAVILSEASQSHRDAKSKDPESAGISTTAEDHSTENPTKAERDLFASDVLRYFLLREIPFGQDGSFSFDALITRYNADLANGYGNLVSRVLALVNTNFKGCIPPYSVRDPKEPKGIPISALFDGYIKSNNFFDFLKNVMGFMGAVDGKISVDKPWVLAKSTDPADRERLSLSLYNACEAIRVITIYLHPILPYSTARVWQQLGLDPAELITENVNLGSIKPGTKLGPLAPIFPRADKSLIEIMTNMEEQNARPETPLKSATTPTPAAPEATDSTHPAAGPRAVHTPSDTLPVGGSTALTTGPEPTPPPAPVSLNTEPPSFINIDDFAKIELRVAQIVVAERIPKADKLLRLEVDLGPYFPRRQILSGIAEHYTPEELIGRRIVVITNLAPRKMRGLESHGMLLAASEGENGKPILATFAEDIALGSRLK